MDKQLGFHIVDEEWHSKYVSGRPPTIMVGLYNDEGETDGEFAIRWHDLGTGRHSEPRLEMFDDAWKLLPRLAGLFADLSLLDSQQATPQQIADLFLQHGLVDMTARTEPA